MFKKAMYVLTIVIIAFLIGFAFYSLAVPVIRCTPNDDLGGFSLLVSNVKTASIAFQGNEDVLKQVENEKEHRYPFHFVGQGYVLIEVNYTNRFGNWGRVTICVNITDLAAEKGESGFFVVDFLEVEKVGWNRVVFEDSNFPCKVEAN